MEKELKQFMRELEDAINESVSGSSSFMAVIDKMENAGYEVSLVLEAVVEVSTKKKSSNLDQEHALQQLSPPRLMSSGKLTLTAQDRRFLQFFKIAADED